MTSTTKKAPKIDAKTSTKTESSVFDALFRNLECEREALSTLMKLMLKARVNRVGIKDFVYTTSLAISDISFTDFRVELSLVQQENSIIISNSDIIYTKDIVQEIIEFLYYYGFRDFDTSKIKYTKTLNTIVLALNEDFMPKRPGASYLVCKV
jgi:hypothetical protein